MWRSSKATRNASASTRSSTEIAAHSSLSLGTLCLKQSEETQPKNRRGTFPVRLLNWTNKVQGPCVGHIGRPQRTPSHTQARVSPSLHNLHVQRGLQAASITPASSTQCGSQTKVWLLGHWLELFPFVKQSHAGATSCGQEGKLATRKNSRFKTSAWRCFAFFF